jgi:tetratricopeptide (TPR) repeat protein
MWFREGGRLSAEQIEYAYFRGHRSCACSPICPSPDDAVTRRVLIKTSRDGYLASTPPGEPSGAAVLREFPEQPVSVAIWRVLRLATLWAIEQPQRRSELLDLQSLESMLVELAANQPFTDDDPRGALACILGEMTSPIPDLRRAAYACLAVTDWALPHGAIETALSYGRAAALLGADARYAWVVGRLHREYSRVLQAEIWFKVAYALAARERDWEVRARSLMSWGHLHLNVGRYRNAKELFERALSTTKRFKLHDREAEAHHYLFTVARATSDHTTAAKHSAAAAATYGPDHPRLPHFAHDLACYWTDQGDHQHALEVLLALLDHHFLEVPAERLLVIGSALRAAGGCGENDAFDRMFESFLSLQGRAPASPLLAQALLLGARGAASLRRWSEAERLLVTAVEAARNTGQNDTRIGAEALLSQVRDESLTAAVSNLYEANRDDVARATVRSLVQGSLATTTGTECVPEDRRRS